jgi:hypothetical protein
MLVRMLASFVAVSLTFAACGGRAVVDASGTGGFIASSSSAQSSSSSSSSSGSTSTCPEFPAIQGRCMTEGQVCPVPYGCCGGSAVCMGGLWRYESAPCGATCVPCSGNFACESGAVCLELAGDCCVSYECRIDPCPGSTECVCVEALCGPALTCTGHTATGIGCACTLCD